MTGPSVYGSVEDGFRHMRQVAEENALAHYAHGRRGLTVLEINCGALEQADGEPIDVAGRFVPTDGFGQEFKRWGAREDERLLCRQLMDAMNPQRDIVVAALHFWETGDGMADLKVEIYLLADIVRAVN